MSRIISIKKKTLLNQRSQQSMRTNLWIILVGAIYIITYLNLDYEQITSTYFLKTY